ncbi:hypothetical protein DY000_02005506 [Brassica cretica]|uniref:Uncharacterized protein n=1 Tax=Brassica cretica TaxID=69181 RepID=A0ABQ7C609_BRACR|nr:hypothetical protein DY000_02005506 [Brassica cretica]
MRVMEMSHRGKEFLSIIQKAESHLRRLLDIPPEYSLVSSKAAPPPSLPPSLSISANPTTPSITSSTDLGQKGDSTMNVVIDKYDTALKGALDELELAKKGFAEKEEVSARQLNESRANLQKLNGMMTRTEGVPGRGARVDGDNVPVLVLSDTSVEGRDSPPPEESRRDGEENTGEVSEDAAVQVSPIARESSVRALELSALNDRERVPGRGAGVDGDNVPVLVLSDTSVEGHDSPPLEESRRDGEENTREVSEDAAVQVSPIARESSVRASELSALNDREKTAVNLHVSPTHPIGERREDPTLPIENPSTVLEEGVPGRGARVDGDNVPVLVLSDTSVEGRDSPPPEESRRGGEENTGEVSEDAAVQVSPIARESSVRASELSALNDRESDREA